MNPIEHVRYAIFERTHLTPQEKSVWYTMSGRDTMRYPSAAFTEQQCIDALNLTIAKKKKRNKTSEFKIVKIRDIRIIEDVGHASNI